MGQVAGLEEELAVREAELKSKMHQDPATILKDKPLILFQRILSSFGVSEGEETSRLHGEGVQHRRALGTDRRFSQKARGCDPDDGGCFIHRAGGSASV